MLDNDLMQELINQQKTNNALIATYLHSQLKEAKQVPGITILSTFALQNPMSPPTAMQLVPKNARRSSVALVNDGPGDIIISTDWFDPTTILQNFVDVGLTPKTLNAAVPIAVLQSGKSISLEGTMAVWAYNLNSTTTASTIAIADSLFVTNVTWDDNDEVNQMFHNDGLMMNERPGSGVIT